MGVRRKKCRGGGGGGIRRVKCEVIFLLRLLQITEQNVKNSSGRKHTIDRMSYLVCYFIHFVFSM